jgi:predicted nucleotide-binding protein
MEIKKLPKIKITQDEKNWLNECYTQLKQNGKIETYKQVKLKTLDLVSLDFEPWKIDERLVTNKVEITVQGVIAIGCEKELFRISDKVFKYIRKALINDADIEEFDLDFIADCIKEDRKLVKVYFKMFSNCNLSLWNSAGTNNRELWGYESIKIGDTAFDTYMKNNSMSEAFIRKQNEIAEYQKKSTTEMENSLVFNRNKDNLDKTKVFIVHGHDDLLKIEVARFIEKLNLEAIILHEIASSGQTIIEKIEANSNVGFGVVLYTPCDFGGKEGSNNVTKPRARQNVVFEHGYLIGKIGRENVCALVKGNIEKPNDISGVVYINKDNGDGWQLQLAKEMKKSGYNIDLNVIL